MDRIPSIRGDELNIRIEINYRLFIYHIKCLPLL